MKLPSPQGAWGTFQKPHTIQVRKVTVPVMGCRLHLARIRG